MALISAMSLNQFLSKALTILVAITVMVCYYLELESRKLLLINNDTNADSYRRITNLRRSINDQVNEDTRRQKIFLSFFYWEQLTMGTNNLLHLTALAAYGGRQVVVPFVKDSQFRGVVTKEGYESLERYYNVAALNYMLRLRGHAALVSWERFQDVCKGRLDVLVYFDYKDLNTTKANFSLATPYFPCKQNRGNMFHGIKIGRRVCVNAFALDSVERFENEVIRGLPCVGIFEWRGTSETNPDRAKFNLTSIVSQVLSYRDASAFLSSKLLHIARDFVRKSLGPDFISVHIRTEQILKAGRNLTTVKKCLRNLKKRVESMRRTNTVDGIPVRVFLATDFTEFGSSSKIGKPARKNAKSLMKKLAPLFPVIFQPAEYKLADRGEVAIVEMNILASGKYLVVLGGGSFQYWVETQFLHKNNNDTTKFEHLAC